MQTTDRDRDRKSLQDLAQMAKGMTPSPSSVASFGPVPSSRSVTSFSSNSAGPTDKDDSGIVDLAAASAADPQAAMRAQTTPLANASLFEDAPPPPPVHSQGGASYVPAPPPVSSQGGISHLAPPSGQYAYQQPAPSVPPPPSNLGVGSVPPPAQYASVHPIAPSLTKKKSGAGALVFVFGSVLALGAAAAGGFLYIKNHKPAEPVAVSTKAPEAAPVVAADPPKSTEAAKVAENTAAPTEKPSDATDLNALPTVAAKTSTGTKVAVRSSKPTAAKEPAEKPAPAEDAAEAAKAKANLDKALAGNSTPAAPAAPAGPPGDLGAALKDASKGGLMQDGQPKSGSMQPAAGGNVPQKPSQGAVTGALGAVLPAARECLGPDDPISKAAVVFNSDGSVYAVTVSGSAAGKPAATCIEKEMKKARIQPFAESSYTANVTIRHN